MIEFLEQPRTMAPLAAEARYTVRCDAARTIVLRFIDRTSGRQMAAQRYIDVTQVSLDAAPLLRRRIRFSPQRHEQSGFTLDDGRTLAVTVTATAYPTTYDDGYAAPAVESVTAVSRFRVGVPVKRCCLLTDLPPVVRTLRQGEEEELTLVATSEVLAAAEAAGESPFRVTITATGYGMEPVVRQYDAPVAMPHPEGVPGGTIPAPMPEQAGIIHFSVVAADFPEAEHLHVDAGACGEVEYRLLPQVEVGCRLAWRSRAGAIEHYTFPLEQIRRLHVKKQRARNADGEPVTRSTTLLERRLCTAPEEPAVLAVLAQIIASPDVWLVTEAGYERVDVRNETMAVHLLGTLGQLEFTLHTRAKSSASWS